MSELLIDRFLIMWGKLDHDTVDEVDALYSKDVKFVDPFVQLEGIDALKRYLRHSYEGATEVTFVFEQPLIDTGEASVRWKMHFAHPRLNGGNTIELPGITHLRFAERVTHHTDYYDAGVLLYEQLPLLGLVIRAIKRRMQT